MVARYSTYSLPLSPVLLALLCVWQPGAAHAASIPNNALDPVTADLAAGRADDAISRLNLSLTAQPADAEAHNLLCRVYYQEQRWDDAIHQCEAAVQLAPLDSEYHLWLGRAYGEKADAIHSIKAYGLAKKVHSEFERAVQLDSKNVDALSDLGEFYTAAPGIVGGGKDKAQAVVQKLEPLEPVQAHQLKGLLAEKEKNYPLAESRVQGGGGSLWSGSRCMDDAGLLLCAPQAMGPDAGGIARRDRCRCKGSQAPRARTGGWSWDP